MITLPGIGAAESKISGGYNYYNSKKDYHNEYFGYSLKLGDHNVVLGYDRYDHLHSQYDTLQSVGLMYTYMGPEHMVGAVVASASDKPFNSIETTTLMGFYGYNFHSRVLGQSSIDLPDGTVYTYDRVTKLYLGIGVSREAVFYGSNFLPVVSYVYQGEKLHFSLGLPITAVVFMPHKQHTFKIIGGVVGNTVLEYEFHLTPSDTFRIKYAQEEDKYRPSDIVIQDNREEYRIIYRRDWIKGEYTHKFNNFAELGFSYAYLTDGYKFQGKYYHSGPSRRLPHTSEYGVNFSLEF